MSEACDARQCSCDGRVTGTGSDLTVYSKNFELVCSSGLTYYSACHAGCQEQSGPGQYFNGCGCSLSDSTSLPPPQSTATPGICDAGCQVIPLAVILFFCILFMFMGTMPGLVASLR